MRGVNRITRCKPVDGKLVLRILEWGAGLLGARRFSLMLIGIPSRRGYLIQFRPKTVEGRILKPVEEATAKLGFLQPRTWRSLSRLQQRR